MRGGSRGTAPVSRQHAGPSQHRLCRVMGTVGSVQDGPRGCAEVSGLRAEHSRAAQLVQCLLVSGLLQQWEARFCPLPAVVLPCRVRSPKYLSFKKYLGAWDHPGVP